MVIATNLRGPEITISGTQKLPIIGQEVQRVNGTNEITGMHMVMMVTGQAGINTKAITMVITVITGTILTETATGEPGSFKPFLQ